VHDPLDSDLPCRVKEGARVGDGSFVVFLGVREAHPVGVVEGSRTSSEADNPTTSSKSSGRTSIAVSGLARPGCPVRVRTRRPDRSSSRAMAAPE
jgi:hypothetical protein